MTSQCIGASIIRRIRDGKTWIKLDNSQMENINKKFLFKKYERKQQYMLNFVSHTISKRDSNISTMAEGQKVDISLNYMCIILYMLHHYVPYIKK